MATRSSAHEFARLLDGVAGAVFVTDDEGRIVYANRACGDWTGWPPAELVGQICRYHSAVDVTGAAAAAAAICPPPEVLAGQERVINVSCPTLDGRLPLRSVRYLPLLGDEQDVQAVLAFAEPHELAAADLDAAQPSADEDQSAQLHEHIKQYRHAQRRRYALDSLVGDSPAMRRVRAQVALAGSGDGCVLISGPPGSGRQHVARAIHYSVDPSPGAPALVPFSCSAMPGEALIASLQAVLRSHRQRDGARRGTLLLIDVDLAPADLQGELATMLSTGAAPLRVLATAREPLGRRAERQEYRNDLACLLSTLTIELLPLALRQADLPLLAQRMLEEFNARGAKQLRGWSPEALDRLAAYAWPGNLAELTEVTREAHGRAEGVEVVPDDLPRRLHLAADAAAQPRKPDESIELEKFLAEIETELIQRALAKAKGNKTKAARLLGMTRPKLYRRLVLLGLEAESRG